MRLLLIAIALLASYQGHAQSISNPTNFDTAFCPTWGSIAIRKQYRWQCLPPGTAGYYLRTQGANADADWANPIAGGTVTSVALSAPAIFSVAGSPITTTGTLALTLATQSANVVFAGPTTGAAAAPTFRALVSDDLPTVPVAKGGTGSTSASGTALDNIAGFANTGLMRRTGPGAYTFGVVVFVAEGGTSCSVASGTCLDNITGFASTGLMRRTGAGVYTFGTGVSVAEGGTGATSAGGTALDNITGFAATGLLRRTGAGTYTLGTTTSLAEGGTGATTQQGALNAITGTQAAKKYVRSDGANSALSDLLAADLKGTSTNDNASAGYVGEYVSSEVLVGSAVSLTSNTDTNITSVSLTAGDWDCHASLWDAPGGGDSVSNFSGSLSTTSNTAATNSGDGCRVYFSTSFNTTSSHAIGTCRKLLNATTTVYLVANIIHSGGTNTGYGFLGCRRMR